jgi:hypothetical protein
MARTLIVESGPLQAIVLGFPRVDAIDAPGLSTDAAGGLEMER